MEDANSYASSIYNGKCVVNYTVDEKQTRAGNSRFASGAGRYKNRGIMPAIKFIISQNL